LSSYYHYLFFLIPPPPPTSPLFPYTTLFRSLARVHARVRRLGALRHHRRRSLPARLARAGRGRGRAREPPPPGPADRLRPRAPEDRKSTRLNSSHVAISYAVFCLKKKKKKRK